MQDAKFMHSLFAHIKGRTAHRSMQCSILFYSYYLTLSCEIIIRNSKRLFQGLKIPTNLHWHNGLALSIAIHFLYHIYDFFKFEFVFFETIKKNLTVFYELTSKQSALQAVYLTSCKLKVGKDKPCYIHK